MPKMKTKSGANEPLTATDLTELERILIQAGADQDSIARIRTDGGVGRFVRSLVGLDREAAKQAFASFLERRTLLQSGFLHTRFCRGDTP